MRRRFPPAGLDGPFPAGAPVALIAAVLIVALLGIAGCGGGDDDVVDRPNGATGPTGPTGSAESACHPNYEGECLDPSASDYDCEGGTGDGPKYTGTVDVVGSDPYDLVADGDGTGCD